jgi:hypothetical protein
MLLRVVLYRFLRRGMMAAVKQADGGLLVDVTSLIAVAVYPLLRRIILITRHCFVGALQSAATGRRFRSEAKQQQYWQGFGVCRGSNCR